MSQENFTIHQYTLGPWDNLMYLLEDNATQKCAVVDPAWDIEVIVKEIQKRELTPSHCLITHNHYDHVNMLEPLLAKYPGLPVYMLDIEIDWSNFSCPNLVRVSAGETIEIGENLKIKTIHTPGHSPGSMSFHFGRNLLTGDAVFIDSCGRADFKGGDPKTLYDTINWLADNLADETVIYPGHGSLERGSDTLANQKKSNPYFVFDNYEDFEAKRMDGYSPGSDMPEVSPEWKKKVDELQPAGAEVSP
jgi:hydroxyacylglutathione hydrolase